MYVSDQPNVPLALIYDIDDRGWRRHNRYSFPHREVLPEDEIAICQCSSSSSSNRSDHQCSRFCTSFD
ncbi:hypothetical protein C4D60_Mb10t07140 [Musa balbisiana]|uniref:Uncharacterized protein n=1 Tax=Musa balbisiana TaxID=52838 RepID=A0A4S8IVD7_MUSBA|nr:hypothetical protein C4D60_Mb10t07140 [Musa balbisiana]